MSDHNRIDDICKSDAMLQILELIDKLCTENKDIDLGAALVIVDGKNHYVNHSVNNLDRVAVLAAGRNLQKRAFLQTETNG